MTALSTHIADAYILMAEVDHYLVRVDLSQINEWEDLSAAHSELITRQNALSQDRKSEFDIIDLALDVLENDCQRKFNCRP